LSGFKFNAQELGVKQRNRSSSRKKRENGCLL